MIFWTGRSMDVLNSADVYLLKVNYEYDRRNCRICSKFPVKTLERSQLMPLWYLLVLIRVRRKKVFLKISQFSQENTCVGFSFQSSCRISGLQPYLKRLQRRCLPVNIAKILKTPSLKNIYQLLLL